MPAKPQTIDEYLAAVSPGQRAALQKLRTVIQAAVPQAEECVSYGLAAFRLDGKPFVAFGASANHCAFYPMSGTTVAALKDELKHYDTSKGTIRFTPDKPLPATLVKKVIRARLAENGGRVREKPARMSKPAARTDPTVVAFLRELEHPLKREIEAVRKIILGVSPTITEGIKWNAPSFRTGDYFATINLRSRESLQLVFHRGAKVKDNSTKKPLIADPSGLIQWLATDRCLVTLGTGKPFITNQAAFERIVRDWIRQL